MMRHSGFLVLAMLISTALVGCGGSSGTAVIAPAADTPTPEQLAEKDNAEKAKAKKYDGKYTPDPSEAAEHSN